MSESTLLVLLAIGTGISIGWLLKAWHGKLSPDGITRLSVSLGTQMELAREDAKRLVAAAEARAEQYATRIYNDATFWRDHCHNLVSKLGLAPAVPLRPPPIPPASGAPLANGMQPNEKKLEERLIERGIDPELAHRIARGDPDIPQDALPQDLAASILRDESGAL